MAQELVVTRATMRAREEIELAFVAAGWEVVAGRSSPHLVAANAGGAPLSIRAYGPFVGVSDGQAFEIIDRLGPYPRVRWGPWY